MKNLAKYFVLAATLVFIPAFASAEISVKDTTSPEFIYNSGYSNEISRIIKVKTKDPATPIPKEEKSLKQKSKWYFWKLVDPSVDVPGTYVDHNSRYDRATTDDL